MSSDSRPDGLNVAWRAQRLDPRRESRSALILVMLMGLATVSVVASTTHALTDLHLTETPFALPR